MAKKIASTFTKTDFTVVYEGETDIGELNVTNLYLTRNVKLFDS